MGLVFIGVIEFFTELYKIVSLKTDNIFVTDLENKFIVKMYLVSTIVFYRNKFGKTICPFFQFSITNVL